jgi:thioredoxin-like negative regulator of GroEL
MYPIIFYFFYIENNSDWQVTKKVLQNFIKKYNRVFVLREVNFDLQKQICNQLNIYGVPTLVVLENKKVVKRYSGVLGSAEIDNIVKNSLIV